MNQLYAVGETACNGVHGRNRLASNSLLESMVFAGRAAEDLMASYDKVKHDQGVFRSIDYTQYQDEKALQELYADLVKKEIDRADKAMKIKEEAEEEGPDSLPSALHRASEKQQNPAARV